MFAHGEIESGIQALLVSKENECVQAFTHVCLRCMDFMKHLCTMHDHQKATSKG
jgi:hypothetical protein